MEAAIKHVTATWRARDGLSLFSQGWIPPEGTKAVVCLIHGLGEHSGRYTHVAQALTDHGYALLSFDLRGHGRSGGQRGHFPGSEQILADIDLLLADAEQRFPGKPRFLYGHSLGGLLALYYALRRKPRVLGMVATSPGLRTALVEQKLKIALAKALRSIAPSLRMPTGLDAKALSRDPQVVTAYQEDALVHEIGTPGLAVTSLEMIDHIYAHAGEFDRPLLLVHGTQDAIAYPTGSQELARLVSCECTLKLWDGMYHETHNEPEKADVLAYTTGWLDAHLEPPASVAAASQGLQAE